MNYKKENYFGNKLQKRIIQNEVEFWFNNRKIILVKSYFSSITKTKNKPKKMKKRKYKVMMSQKG